jgi:hypothetical protein
LSAAYATAKVAYEALCPEMFDDRPAGTMKRFAWWTMALLSGAIALYAAGVLFVPGFGPPFVARLRAIVPWAVWSHIVGSLIALAAGPLQFNSRLRSRALGFHRWNGRVYVVAVLVGGIGALALAPMSQEGIVTHVGFGALAVCWLFCTIQGYRAIRTGDDVVHRVWMIRSFALTFAAVTLRIILPLELAFGMPFAIAYRIVSWACWVPNLAIAAWVGRAGRPFARSPIAAVTL